MPQADKPCTDKTYGFEYRYGRSLWLINVVAGSETEARDRLMVAGTYGTCIGELKATIPAAPGAGLLTRLICWWRNR